MGGFDWLLDPMHPNHSVSIAAAALHSRQINAEIFLCVA